MIRLNVGFSRKVGEPDFGSRGASVNLDIELADAAIDAPQELQASIRRLYALAREAVAEELQHSRNDTAESRKQGGNNGSAPGPMTMAQRKAIEAIARDMGIDPSAEIHRRFGLDMEQLSLAQASEAIDHLKHLQTAGNDSSS